MLPPAPARLSTTTGWPRSLLMYWPTTRARMSVVPPAENGTTIVIGLLGKAWACAASGASARAGDSHGGEREGTAQCRHGKSSEKMETRRHAPEAKRTKQLLYRHLP
jgi:hypothetical protein